MSMFKKLTTDGLEAKKDTLGGGTVVRESGVYLATVETAFAGESSGGAMNVTVIYKMEDGSEFRDTQYITSGRDKGQKNYYEKDGKQIPLPGFSVIDDLCILTTESPLSEQDTTERVIKLYDFDAKKEVPTSVQCLTDLEGKQVLIALQKVVDNKSKKNDATGEYEKSNEKREYNEVAKLFHSELKLTVVEAINGQEATFHDAWLKKNEGKDRVKFEEVAATGVAGAPKRASAPPVAGNAPVAKTGTGLFGKRS